MAFAAKSVDGAERFDERFLRQFPGLFAIADDTENRVIQSALRANRELPDAAEVAIITQDTEAGRHVLRHSTSHVLAQAVTQLFPGAKYSNPEDPEGDTRDTIEFIRRIKRLNPAAEIIVRGTDCRRTGDSREEQCDRCYCNGKAYGTSYLPRMAARFT